MKTLEQLFLRTISARIIVIAFLLAGLTGINAQDFTKSYNGTYDVDKGAVLVIKNKFGYVQCQTWDQSSVSIAVTVKVDASSQEKANKVFDKITVDLSGTRTRVQGITTMENVNNADFSINYDIRMPKWITLDLDNKFGDIYIGEVDGTAKINLEYGSLEADSFNAPADITLKFSDAETGYIKSGSLNIEYSEWDAEGAGDLKVRSRFSEVNIEKMANLNLDSQYDEITVEYAGNVIAINRFSEMDFSSINGDFEFDTEYGDIDVEYISPSFKNGKVRNSFAGVDLKFDPKAAMNINAELQFGDLRYPKANASLNHEVVGYTTNIYKGKIGTSPVSQLTINSKHADVTIEFSE